METVMLKNFVFKNSERGFILTRYTGDKEIEDLDIPEVVRGKPVTSIARDVFKGIRVGNLNLPMFLEIIDLDFSLFEVTTVTVNALCIDISKLSLRTLGNTVFTLDEHHQLLNRYANEEINAFTIAGESLYSNVKDYLNYNNLEVIQTDNEMYLLPLVPNGNEMYYILSESIGTQFNNSDYVELYTKDGEAVGESVGKAEFLEELLLTLTQYLLVYEEATQLVFIRHNRAIDCIDYLGHETSITIPATVGADVVYGVRGTTLSQLNLKTITISVGILGMDTKVLLGAEEVVIPETVVIFRGSMNPEGNANIYTQKNSEADKHFSGQENVRVNVVGERTLTDFLFNLQIPTIHYRGKLLMATGIVEELYMGAEVYFNYSALQTDSVITDIALVGYHVKLPTDEIVISDEVIATPTAGVFDTGIILSEIIMNQMSKLAKESLRPTLVK